MSHATSQRVVRVWFDNRMLELTRDITKRFPAVKSASTMGRPVIRFHFGIFYDRLIAYIPVDSV